MKKKIGVISLFSGCGGMDLGFEGGFYVKTKSINPNLHPDWACGLRHSDSWTKLPETVFETVFANDISRAAQIAWVSYFRKRGRSDSSFIHGSIVDLVKKYERGEFFFPNAEIVIGGFPCQDFSVAGKRKGFLSHRSHNGGLLSENDDPTEENRGRLYVWMKKVIEIVRPKVFVAENVKGLISLASAKEIIENDFKQVGAGYFVQAKVLYAPNFGVPQRRERIFFIGLNKEALNSDAANYFASHKNSGEYELFPEPTHGNNECTLFDSNKSLLPYVTVRDYIGDLVEPDQSIDLSHQAYSKARFYGNHCQGNTEIDMNSVGPTIRSEHHGNIEFRRLSPQHGGKYLNEWNMGLPERRLSVRECARLQTFPDDFEFVSVDASKKNGTHVSASEGYKLVGNAVPPLLAFHIAWRLQTLWPVLFKDECERKKGFKHDRFSYRQS